ncbi:hypothetical protein CGZ93_00655 [Enemella dayhoffiae]|uniref:EcsC family protein n=1 Tax=Enemella dayhoffiae TaxID=2016507 RepID=A0A255HFA0_9ACTN|nr:EcsC family protein [Enemella dayhoffiae]OYO25014.1 hypothetical protein CGZ93_00655 [Enemella dayhoffiae]
MANNVRDTLGSLVPAGGFGPNGAGKVLRRVMAVAIDGMGQLPPARESAGRQLGKHQNADKAIDILIQQHVALAGAQGFVTNIGGLITSLVSLPANIAGVAVLQARMVATVAHLRGYDVTDPRVRTAIAMCLVGDNLDSILGDADLPTSPLVVATAPVYDAGLDTKITDRVAGDLLTRITGKRMVVAMTKRVPVLGGGVGAAFDGWDTLQVGRYAKTQLVDRRSAKPASAE